jgi:putative nucleotidyltransferase with HDIG domain
LAITSDPVRAMRAVRHAVDFDFAIEEVTRDAIREAASQLSVVSVERVRDELLKMMATHAPGEALKMLLELELLPVVVPEIAALQDTIQTPPHFESALAHTLRVVASIVQLEQVVADGEQLSEAKLIEARETLAPYGGQLAEHLGRRFDGGLDGRQVLRLGALFHDVGKAKTMSVDPDGRIRFLGHEEAGARLTSQRLTSLRLSREVIRHISALVEGHMRPLLLAQNPKLSRRAIFRFFRNTSGAGLDITLLALADQLALARNGKSDPQWRRLLDVVSSLQQHYFEHFAETVGPTAILDGREIMEILQIEPGPIVGYLLDQLLEAQAAGEVSNREEAVGLVTQLTEINEE